jgi:hypothetical protein
MVPTLSLKSLDPDGSGKATTTNKAGKTWVHEFAAGADLERSAMAMSSRLAGTSGLKSRSVTVLTTCEWRETPT